VESSSASPLFTSTPSEPGCPFMARVELDPNTGCWLWTGSLDTHGYGQFRGRQAHIVAWEAVRGPVPDGLVLDHIVCRVRRCVSVAHTRAVTKRTNTLENSFAPTAINAQKLECPQGHPYDLDNTTRAKDGSRRCRACNRERARAWRARRHE
jgi:hypothetical protein